LYRQLVRQWAAVLAIGTASVSIVAATPTLQFNRDIRPLLSDNCFQCHGPDSGSRKAGLRLDTKEGLYGGTKKHGPVLTAGDPARSALWSRITTSDPDDRMPPPESHKELKADQRAILKRWIEEGAPWQPHWAFIKPERPAVPLVRDRPV
jgi:mono/diheme cytochrome c family protein